MTSPDPPFPLLPAVLLTLLAFAANSILGRLAMAEGLIGPGAFTALRLGAGALVLAALALSRPSGRAAARATASPASAVTLFLYAAAFSFAYLRIDAAIGALALFASVQATMFVGALMGGERPGPARWLGALSALAGLGALVAPGAAAPDGLALALMAVSGAAWGCFSLIGRRGGAPLPRMAGAFALAAPLGFALWGVAALAGESGAMDPRGAALALASGGLTSACGYALWYAILPRLRATTAALAQLTVPLITLGGGMAVLGEPLTWRFVVAAVLVLGGVGAATMVAERPPAARKTP
ncbi:DMT family transporter [Rubrimonas cliftonensis]|uniref:Threonine/homoserine efflux transporter RhtA n=1 Tax=Rubrimonas cliftonensis TaxID=89524 RepID=A0A1H3X4W0_9RHOB|nr:DMT family transporter [Rubrimonas cliftonensis]SDZ94427.1 Threonine/homoserine efflux transporter RhtA [Rubrimonas cliftonensis]